MKAKLYLVKKVDVKNSLIAKLIGFLLLWPLSINPALSKNINNQLLSYQLEKNLNQNRYDLLQDIFLQGAFDQFYKQYLDFRGKYKDAKWSIKIKSNHLNKKFLYIRITSKRGIGDQVYNLNTKQTIEIETLRNKIKSYKVISEESILNTEDSPLDVKLISPDKVSTGERYEMSLIIESPLDNSLIAGGMIVIKNQSKNNITNDQFGIKPNLSGGLFKYIQAPLEPGFQTISAIITHPEGIYSITKKIKVDL